MRLTTFDQAEERYVFLRLCEKDFLMAKAALGLIRRYRRSDVKSALLRDAIVSYVRPFSTNRGRIIKKLQLDEAVVPMDKAPLHRELVGFRDQVFAHTDIEAYDPQLHRWTTKSGFVYPMVFRSLSLQKLLSRVLEIVSLVRDVHRATELEERGIEAEWLDAARARPG